MPGHPPSFVSTSLRHTPQACTLMRTSPAAGLGISRSTIWNSAPGFGTCAAFWTYAPGLGTCAAFVGAIATFVAAIMRPSIGHRALPGHEWRRVELQVGRQEEVAVYAAARSTVVDHASQISRRFAMLHREFALN